MKTGRNFQDGLLAEYLTEEGRQALREGRMIWPEGIAAAREKARRDIVRQIRVAADMELQHLEIEETAAGAIAGIDPADLFAARETAKIFGVSLSARLSPSAAAAFLAGPAAARAVIDAFKILGCETLVVPRPAPPAPGTTSRPAAGGAAVLREAARHAYEHGLFVGAEIPAADYARAGFAAAEEYPLRAALTLSTPEDLAAARAGNATGFYVRVCPDEGKAPGGRYLHAAGPPWGPDPLREALGGVLAGEVKTLVFSAAPQNAGEAADPGRALAAENDLLRDVLLSLERETLRR